MPSFIMSGSNLMLLPAQWCSLQATHFPCPLQHKDAGNNTGLITLPGCHRSYRHRAQDLQHSPKSGLSLAQHIPGDAANG